MNAPGRIWVTAYYSQNRSEHVREWSERGYDDLQAYEYIRRDPGVLAALRYALEPVMLKQRFSYSGWV